MQALVIGVRVINALVHIPSIARSCYRVGYEATRSVGNDDDLSATLREVDELFRQIVNACGYFPSSLPSRPRDPHPAPPVFGLQGHIYWDEIHAHLEANPTFNRREIVCDRVLDLLGPSPRVVFPREPTVRGKYVLAGFLSPFMLIIDTVRKVSSVAKLVLGLDNKKLCLSKRCYEIGREVFQLICQPLRAVALAGSITLGVIHPRTGQKALRIVARIFGESSCLILRKLASSGSLSLSPLHINLTEELVQDDSPLMKSLPHLELQKLFSYLPSRDIANVSQTSKYLSSVCRNVTLQRAQTFVKGIQESKEMSHLLLCFGLDSVEKVPQTPAEAITFFTQLSFLIKVLKQEYSIEPEPNIDILSSAEMFLSFLQTHLPRLLGQNMEYEISTKLNELCLQKNKWLLYRFSLGNLSQILVAAAKKNVSLQDVFSGKCKDLFSVYSGGEFLQKEWDSLLNLIKKVPGQSTNEASRHIETYIAKRADPLIRFLIQVHQDYASLTYGPSTIEQRHIGAPKELLCVLSQRPIEHVVHHTKNRALLADKDVVEEKIRQGVKYVEIEGKNYSLSQFETQVDRETQEVINRTITLYRSLIHVLDIWTELLSHPIDLPELPSFIPNASLFPPCSITGKPIRHVACPKGHMDIFYDRSSLENWLEMRPQEAPRGWPADTLFNEENVSWQNLPVQGAIDHILSSSATSRFRDRLIARANSLAGTEPVATT